MITHKTIETVRQHLSELLAQDSVLGASLWHELLKLHPADITQLFTMLETDEFKPLFLALPDAVRKGVFAEFSDTQKIFCLSFLDDHARTALLGSMPIDELTDFFDSLSDDELKRYLKLLHRKDREQVLSLMQFNPESVGGIMDTNVLTLMQDFTVEKSIQILQRLQPRRELHQQIYVTNQENQLVGHIRLEDLVLKSPKTRLAAILRPNELVAQVTQDREEVAKQMLHYSLTTVPVVGSNAVFLGIIESQTLIEIIEEEASEDIYRISALSPIKHTYFETSFTRLLLQRSSILLMLLVLQSLSTMIIEYYQATLCGFFMYFITMLISTGGNTSSQSSALAIQGMATGEIAGSTIWRFIKRELIMALMIALILGTFSWLRIYLTHHDMLGSVIVSVSLGMIVLVSVMLGSCMPIVLKKLGMDPAHSAGPLLATLMDIVGLFVYCLITQWAMA